MNHQSRHQSEKSTFNGCWHGGRPSTAYFGEHTKQHPVPNTARVEMYVTTRELAGPIEDLSPPFP
jgi:hypothetical protein